MGLEKVANRYRAKKGDSAPMRAALDIRVQQILEDELASTMEKFSAEAAWGAVMDVETGEIVALASLPDFDPNAPGAAAADSRRNRATYDRYELGSAFKAFTAAAVIDKGLGDEATKYDARGSFQVADRRISDFHGENRILTLSEVVQHSSNIGAARMALDLGATEQQRFLAALGLFEALPIELAENRAPDLPAKWGPVESVTVSYGHGIAVTPLHLLAAFSAMVNGGDYRTPVFLSQTRAPDGRRVIGEDTSAAMRRILRRVITDGTAGWNAAPAFARFVTRAAPLLGLAPVNETTALASFVSGEPPAPRREAQLQKTSREEQLSLDSGGGAP
jgi:cell division protein FtsI (penicillin-binding protein 3)